MKIKVLLMLLASGLVAMAAWYVHVPNPDSAAHQPEAPARDVQAREVQADPIPEKYRETVDKGLEYLIKHQFKDGHWEGDDGKHPVAMTALAGMALLMEGSNVLKGKYSANLRKAVDWLMDQSRAGREGLIFSEHPSETDRYMEGHGLATQFLAWFYQNETDKARREKLHDILTRAVKYIVKAQSTQGGWYHTSKVEGHDLDHISPTAIQIQALYMVGNLNIPIQSEVVAASAQEYLKMTLEKYDKAGKPGARRGKPAETAMALACRFGPDAFLNEDGLCLTWFKDCRTEIPVGRDIKFGQDELTHYYYAQAVFNLKLNAEANAGSEAVAWTAYRTALFDHLQSTQNKDGCWPAPVDSQGGISVGPV